MLTANDMMNVKNRLIRPNCRGQRSDCRGEHPGQRFLPLQSDLRPL